MCGVTYNIKYENCEATWHSNMNIVSCFSRRNQSLPPLNIPGRPRIPVTETTQLNVRVIDPTAITGANSHPAITPFHGPCPRLPVDVSSRGWTKESSYYTTEKGPDSDEPWKFCYTSFLVFADWSTFKPREWQASNFSLQYHYLIKHTGSKNKGIDHLT